MTSLNFKTTQEINEIGRMNLFQIFKKSSYSEDSVFVPLPWPSRQQPVPRRSKVSYVLKRP